ncbi:HNH endonuclease [Duganella sp. HH101]|uniref:HNH endonuclease n=1 Tax=Duganella sp. HH101 TaxID=1781066 RepID=UPI000892DA8A|nr:hypothetical protein [Duganella sp. HH101]OEZ98157.1 hypothetical protein DUGA2_57270 [Duganella sp. HH101]
MPSLIPTRVLCESLSIGNLSSALVSRVRAHGTLEWSTKLDGITDLRSELLKIQHFRCAYCQTPIFADQNGLRELEHILPKHASPYVDITTGFTSIFSDRYHTYGYEQFCFEPKNIIITCKQCNSSKTTFDPLFIRSLVLSDYPVIATDFFWVHPYFHHYSEHITISENWTYKGETYEGKALIRVCKLDEIEVLARRQMAAALAEHASNLKLTLKKFSAHIDDLAASDCVNVIVLKFGISVPDAEALVAAWFKHGADITSKSLSSALALTRTIQAKLARLGVKKR